MGRPPIPEILQREVRRHCGFGCVICGRMPTQIEHIIPFSEVKDHQFENLALLCANCHQDVTAGRRSKRSVIEARKAPFCKRVGDAAYPVPVDGQYNVDFGSIRLISRPGASLIPFVVNGEVPIKIVLGNRPIFDINIKGPDGRSLLLMKENTFSFTPSRVWDVKLTGAHLKIRYGERRVLADIRISNGQISFNTLRMVSGSVPIYASEDGIFLPKTENILHNFAIDVGAGDPGVAFQIGDGIGYPIMPSFLIPDVEPLVRADPWELVFSVSKRFIGKEVGLGAV